ncbi:hypothetical protein SDC9_139900 [bioreactor metagenome]|uniref:Shikimate kinase n=1 Tax=bioreactor metagenome TaxID=1076179 RepID=A0A645DTD8_9ZZZZ
MKKLIIIKGTMGSGKTSISLNLQKELTPSVFLDGDWCWSMNPFTVNDNTKRMVVDNITFLLNNFIKCEQYKYIIFCWVMHEKAISDSIIDKLDLSKVELSIISLRVNKDELAKRITKDIKDNKRDKESLNRSLDRLKNFDYSESSVIDVDNKSVENITKEIIKIVNKSEND